MHENEHSFHDCVVIGAGAAGMVCGAAAARKGRRVLLLEHNDAPGRKINVTGGGKCNFSNTRIGPEDYFSQNSAFCRSALSRFGPAEALDLMASAGIAVEEREHGQLFCQRSAKDVSALLRRNCEQAGCSFAFGVKVRALRGAQGSGARFELRTSSGILFARSVAVATGGPAWPQVGATGTGYELARAMGHAIVPPRPALAGLVMVPDWPLTELAGISVPVSIRVLSPGQATHNARPRKGGQRASEVPDPAAFTLPLLFTHKGVSGPAALQASLYWHKGMLLSIDFLPGDDVEAQLDAPGAGKLPCKGLLRRLLPDRLALALLPPDLAEKQIARLTREERDRLSACLHGYCAAPLRTEGFARAEVAAGGVSTAQVSSRSMESALAPGLFFCGEVLDVTGRLGGYNLHWAFASGLAAGESMGAE